MAIKVLEDIMALGSIMAILVICEEIWASIAIKDIMAISVITSSRAIMATNGNLVKKTTKNYLHDKKNS